MTKPIGTYCDTRIPLIQDIAETFGNTLSELPKPEALWLIAKVSYEAWVEIAIDDISQETMAVCDRLDELSNLEKIRLLKALINS